MKRLLRIGLIGLAILVFGAAALIAPIAMAFIGIKPVEVGAVGPAQIVADGYVTVSVVPTNIGLILVDCGNTPDASAIIAGMGERGWRPMQVTAILLTHGHGDHVGGCAQFPAAKVYALAEEVDHIEGRQKPRGPLPSRMPLEERPFKVDFPLQDGQKISIGGHDVEIFAVPGHTVGSAAYLIDGALFLGDSASATTKGTVRGAPWVFSDDTTQNQASLRALAQRLKDRRDEVHHLIFSHTGPLEGFGPLLDF